MSVLKFLSKFGFDLAFWYTHEDSSYGNYYCDNDGYHIEDIRGHPDFIECCSMSDSLPSVLYDNQDGVPDAYVYYNNKLCPINDNQKIRNIIDGDILLRENSLFIYDNGSMYKIKLSDKKAVYFKSNIKNGSICIKLTLQKNQLLDWLKSLKINTESDIRIRELIVNIINFGN